MARLPLTYEDTLNDLESEDLKNIERYASVLSIEECFEALGVEQDSVSEESLAYAKRVWKRGRAQAINSAGEKLFHQMKQRGGSVPALDYLKQMSGTFQAEVTPTAGQGFKFNVVIDPEDK